MKRGLAAFAAAIVVVVAVVLVRTAMVSAPPLAAIAAPPPNVNAMEVAQHLSAAIRFKTISYGNQAHEAEKNAQLDALRGLDGEDLPRLSSRRDARDHRQKPISSRGRAKIQKLRRFF